MSLRSVVVVSGGRSGEDIWTWLSPLSSGSIMGTRRPHVSENIRGIGEIGTSGSVKMVSLEHEPVVPIVGDDLYIRRSKLWRNSI